MKDHPLYKRIIYTAVENVAQVGDMFTCDDVSTYIRSLNKYKTLKFANCSIAYYLKQTDKVEYLGIVDKNGVPKEKGCIRFRRLV